MSDISINDLDSFVAFVDRECNGNSNDPKIAAKFLPINLHYKTLIDESIDPFSDKYFGSQIDLYEEISGRQLDQQTGELHPTDVSALINCPNPLGVNDVNFISEQVRTISSMLSLSCLGADAQVLDLGAGHGLSSEVYAFCGCRVRSIDLDPAFCELGTKRAEARSLRITRTLMNFDSVSNIETNSYEAAFFFQSLHHALRPWRLISDLKPKLTNDGVIAFAGEPVQDLWWRHWGLRLDHESLYVARKFGWFESGWSRNFISECFKRNGLELLLFNMGLSGGYIGIASKAADKLKKISDKAATLGGLAIRDGEIGSSFQNYFSQIGKLAKNALGGWVSQR